MALLKVSLIQHISPTGLDGRIYLGEEEKKNTNTKHISHTFFLADVEAKYMSMLEKKSDVSQRHYRFSV